MNYGVLFTAWVGGGLVWSRLQQMLTAQSGGNYTSSFLPAGGLLILGGLLTFGIRPPQPASALAPAGPVGGVGATRS